MCIRDRLKYCLNVGITHWDTDNSQSLDMSRRETFFAPTRIQKRMQDWGLAEFSQRSTAFMQEAAMQSRSWLTVNHIQGLDALMSCFADIAQGKSNPAQGLIVDL